MCIRSLVGLVALGIPFVTTGLTALLVVVEPSRAFAQTPPRVRAALPASRPAGSRVVIDGTRTPERIADETVALSLILSWASLVADGDIAERRFTTITRPMQLQPADLTTLRAELTRIRPTLLAARARAQTSAAGRAASAAPPTIVEIQALALGAYGRLLGALSADGATKLRDHVTSLKRSMGIDGPAASGSAALRCDDDRHNGEGFEGFCMARKSSYAP